MTKRLLFSIVALSALPLLRTQASAGTCVEWRTVGGKTWCSRTTTGSIIVEMTFNQDCGVEGTGCTANVSAEGSPNIAFCTDPNNPLGPPIKTTCTEFVTFAGPANPCNLQTAQTAQACAGDGLPCPNGRSDCCGGLQCVDNSATDHTKVCRVKGTGGGGGGGGSTQTCVSTTEFPPSGGCQSACEALFPGQGSVVVDVVPIEMNMEFLLSIPPGVESATTEAAASSSFECPPTSSFCTVNETCTIDPKKIQFEAIREYQCTVTFAGIPG